MFVSFVFGAEKTTGRIIALFSFVHASMPVHRGFLPKSVAEARTQDVPPKTAPARYAPNPRLLGGNGFPSRLDGLMFFFLGDIPHRNSEMLSECVFFVFCLGTCRMFQRFKGFSGKLSQIFKMAQFLLKHDSWEQGYRAPGNLPISLFLVEKGNLPGTMPDIHKRILVIYSDPERSFSGMRRHQSMEVVYNPSSIPVIDSVKIQLASPQTKSKAAKQLLEHVT